MNATPRTPRAPQTPRGAATPRSKPDDEVPSWSTKSSFNAFSREPPSPEVMSARRTASRADTLHVEVERLEEAALIARVRAAKAALRANALRMATDEQAGALAEHRHEAAGLPTGSPRRRKKDVGAAWMHESEERAALSRRVMLEAARACRRHEETMASAADAAKRERESAERDHDLKTAIKEERIKLLALQEQEAAEVARQRKAAAKRLATIKGNSAEKAHQKYLLEKAAADFEKQRDEATKRRKAEEKETAQRAERRRADVQARLQAEMADLSEQRDAREDLRRLDAARETARRKQLVAEEASAVLGVRLVALERLQKKSELLHRAAEQAAYEQRAQERAERMAESGEGDVSELVLTPDNIAELKTAELREALGMRGVPTIGMIRIDLISRLLEELQAEAKAAAEAAAEKAKQRLPPPPEMEAEFHEAEKRHAIALQRASVARQAAAKAAKEFVRLKRLQSQPKAPPVPVAPPKTF